MLEAGAGEGGSVYKVLLLLAQRLECGFQKQCESAGPGCSVLIIQD